MLIAIGHAATGGGVHIGVGGLQLLPEAMLGSMVGAVSEGLVWVHMICAITRN